MPLNTLQIAANIVTTHIAFMDEDIAITYSPGKLTKKEINGLSAAAIAADQDAADLYAQCICRWVTKWDILEPKLDAEGAPVLDEQQQPIMVMFPFDWQRIANELPIPLTRFIVQELTQGNTVGEANGTTSPNS